MCALPSLHVASPTMLDFARLKTPPEHGDTLVEPHSSAWIGLARENHRQLAQADVPLLGSTLADWRARTRKQLVGTEEPLLFVLGHQPEFIHPGVWAKHVAAYRAAAACGGVAINLIVDSDAPKTNALRVPHIENAEVELRSVLCLRFPTDCAYEDAPRLNHDDVSRFEQEVAQAMGSRFAGSQMPAFFRSLERDDPRGDGVDQVTSARQTVEAQFGVSLREHRVRDLWCTPLLADMLLNADGFAACYNQALSEYRRTNHVRSPQRPIPDLLQTEDRTEVPVWVYRKGEPRRRLFVKRAGGRVYLFAEEQETGRLDAGEQDLCGALEEFAAQELKWRLRPRALTLTIWARLLLADLFIHGIGGAKYDRISDAIIRDYYRISPPAFACASATLHLDLPIKKVTDRQVGELHRLVRDLQFNLPRLESSGDVGWRRLVAEREQAVQESTRLRDRTPGDGHARQRAFDRIRRFNHVLLAARDDLRLGAQRRLVEAETGLRRSRLALSREYFFGLYDRRRLEQLLDALPAVGAYRV